MADAPQSSKPSFFLPYFRQTVATALNVQLPFVRIVARPDPDKWAYQTGTTAAAIYLAPNIDLPNAGAGRIGTPVSQELQVIIRTRSLVDSAGGNDTSSLTHFDNEVAVTDAIHLQHVVISSVNPFIMPPRLIPGGESITRNEKLVGVLESVIRFRLDFVLAVDT